MFLSIYVYEKLINIIKEHEGFYPNIYRCSKGINTVGYGLTHIDNVQANYLGVENFDGIVNLSEKDARHLLKYEVDKNIGQLRKLDWVNNLTNYAKIVLIDVVFNVGFNGMLKFKNMIKYMKESDFEKAGLELMDSNLLNDVKGRNIRMGIYLITGVLMDIENARNLYNIYEKRI